jgi:transcriptional regulator with XRE-family HTH domain
VSIDSGKPFDSEQVTFRELARHILGQSARPLSTNEIWSEAVRTGLAGQLRSVGETPNATLGSYLSTGCGGPNPIFVRDDSRPARYALAQLANSAEWNVACGRSPVVLEQTVARRGSSQPAQTWRFGDRLLRARVEHRLTQTELGEKLSVPQTTVSAWERGMRIPAEPQVLEGLMVHLGIALSSDDVEIPVHLRTLDQRRTRSVEDSSAIGDDDGGLEALDGQDDDQDSESLPLCEVSIRQNPQSVFQIVNDIAEGLYDLEPDFQREFVWDREKQSKLIESALMGIPFPIVYLAESPDGKMIVVDGLQRLSTFRDFLQNKFRLDSKIQILKGRLFRELDLSFRKKIERTTLPLIVLDKATPERTRLNIFERVNGGVPLTRQQMRNCLYNGIATRWIRDAAQSALFQQVLSATSRREMSRSMRDREIVNRFVSFQLLGQSEYRGDMDDFLGRGLDALNKCSPTQCASLWAALENGIRSNAMLFGTFMFRRHDPEYPRRSQLNLALFDVMCVTLAEFPLQQTQAHQEQLRRGFFGLLADPGFVSAIRFSTNQREKVRQRFWMVEEMVLGALGDQ